ncbi:unnamed protein product [Cunninghamella blakesleeana]
MGTINRLNHVRIEEDIDFSTLIQNQAILKGLEKSGYAKPSPIQLQAIPLGRLGVDLIAQAKSGTGKTVVFGVIALEAIQARIKAPQVLMIAPTREIAIQIRDVVQKLGQCIPQFKCGAFIGGLSLKGDIQRLPECQALVCTPGRLMWLLENKLLSTNTIKLLVLDEADKLMTEAFKDQINYIYKKLPVNKQTVAFSATFTDELLGSLNQFVRSPQIVKLTYDTPILEEVQQYYVKINVQDIPNENQGTAGQFLRNMQIYKAKFEKTAEILSKIDFYQCMIFVNSFPQANELSKWLTGMGWQSGHICAGISQEKRLQVMDSMRQFKMRVLVCSDLIARGIDIDRVNLVINMDYPRDIETYHHRVGRSGRYGTSGIAINLIASEEDETFLKSLQDLDINILSLPDQVTYGAYHKELNTEEEKVWQRHQQQRIKKQETPLEYIKVQIIKQQKNDKQTKDVNTSPSHIYEQKKKKNLAKRKNKDEMESSFLNNDDKNNTKKKKLQSYGIHSLQQQSSSSIPIGMKNELCGYQYSLPESLSKPESSATSSQPPTQSNFITPYSQYYSNNYNHPHYYYYYYDYYYQNQLTIPPPLLLPPNPLFPFKKRTPFLPPDLFF